MSLTPQTPEPGPLPEPMAVPTSQVPAPGIQWAPAVQYPSGPVYQPGVGWVYAPPPPPRRSSGRLVGVVLGAVAVAATLAVTAGLLLGSRLGASHGQEAARDVLAVPPVGACYDVLIGEFSVFNGGAETDKEVSCNRPHSAETIASGQIDDVDPNDWPVQSDEQTQRLFAGCEKAADRFLGGHWRMTMTRLMLSIPGSGAWRDGAHWFRCDLGATADIFGDLVLTRGSLRDTAEFITCVRWELASDESIDTMSPADCGTRHDGEFAGAYEADIAHGNVPVTDEDIDAFSDGCWPIVLDFLERTDLPDELAFWFYHPVRHDDLDQSVVCIVGPDGDRQFTESLKGIGSAPLPFA